MLHAWTQTYTHTHTWARTNTHTQNLLDSLRQGSITLHLAYSLLALLYNSFNNLSVHPCTHGNFSRVKFESFKQCTGGVWQGQLGVQIQDDVVSNWWTQGQPWWIHWLQWKQGSGWKWSENKQAEQMLSHLFKLYFPMVNGSWLRVCLSHHFLAYKIFIFHALWFDCSYNSYQLRSNSKWHWNVAN